MKRTMHLLHAVLFAGILSGAAGPALAKGLTTEDAEKAFDAFGGWLDLAKKPAEADASYQFLQKNKDAFQKLGLGDLAKISQKTYGTCAKGLKTLEKEMRRSMKIRQELLKAKNGARFGQKMSSILIGAAPNLQWMVQQLCQQYNNMDRESFEEFKQDFLSEMQWAFEADEEVLMWTDDMTAISMEATPKGTQQGHFMNWQGQRQPINPVQPGVSGQKWLGIRVRTMDEEELKPLKLTEAVVVSKVYDDGPASDAGLKVDDIIVEIDGEAVASSGRMRKLLDKMSVGDSVKVAYMREGKKANVEMEVAAKPANVR